MAQAIFNEPFNYSSRTRNAGWSAKPGPEPQTYPQEFIDAAISAGVAEPVKPARKGQKKESQDG
ncbi:hypothetical protein RSK20926_11789 [Roseobacter sp. SK209-2-6]|uniref:hypothetical protein n=1 Tax=Roseobacter sp. SK209-2-6 TaxID=388739 RepID=UPI0000F3C7F3|nr:hypothetical protein [Roseobacter sp. SK209-2-6]EBA18399.1 hypothetical protein RSK20926_11789 [Roseobacter sp. SK209-2-6]